MTEHDPQNPQAQPDDRELEQFLARRSELSRLHRDSSQEQAPPQLDAKVLDAAREELRRTKRPRRLLRWDNPLALAASALLVVGLGWLTVPRAPAPPPPPAESEVAPPAAPASAPPAEAAPVPRPAIAPPQVLANQAETASPRQRVLPPPPKAPAPESLKPAPVITSAPVTEPDTAPPSAMDKSLPPAQAYVPSAEPSVSVTAKRAEEQQETRQNQDQARLFTPPPAAPAPPPPPTAAAVSRSYAAPVASAPAPSLPAAGVADPCVAPLRPQAQQQAAPEQHLDSPAWLDQIRTLRQTDENAARAELACFVARRSAAEVPQDLLPLLPRR